MSLKQYITILAGKLANREGGALTTWAIKRFIKRYKVNMQEALHPDPSSYSTFNEFFTRELKPDARVINDSNLICPVDGSISQLGTIADNGSIFQAKGHKYTAMQLLAGNTELASRFNNGSFITIYLSPRDYHRIHMPCDGKLLAMHYVPGSLYSVNPKTVSRVPELFARNERLVCEFENDILGHFVLVMVGATIVGSMSTQWHGVVNASRPADIQSFGYGVTGPTLEKGDEMGQFQLGSTVILLFEPNKVVFDNRLMEKSPVQLGESLIQTQHQ